MVHALIISSCALCGKKRKLEQSHIIPQFVYRWAKQTSSEPERPNPPTRAMLCGQCEDRFSLFESEFARHVFHPFTEKSLLAAKYAGWLRQFATSVCWRIIEEGVATNTLGEGAARWAPELSSCRETWRQYLLGKRPDVGVNTLHLLPWYAFKLKEENVGPALVAALRLLPNSVTQTDDPTRHTIDQVVWFGNRDAFVYAKLGPFVLLGVIVDSVPQQWRGTRLNAEGKLKPREVSVPDYCRDFLGSAARHF